MEVKHDTSHHSIFLWIEGQSGKNMCQGGKPSFTHLMNVCGSAYENGCVVDGTCATAAY